MTILNKNQKETITCLADAVLPPPAERRVSAQRIADRVEEFLAVSDSPPLTLIRTLLDVMYALVLVKKLGVATSEIRDKIREALSSPIEIIQDAARTLHVLITYIYYSDPAVDEQVGYVRFRNRPRASAARVSDKLEFKTHTAVPNKNYDVCIVGSGVAGAVLAYRLAKAGKMVLVLEAGSYYSAKDYSDDELLMLGRLYKGGIFQAAGGSLAVLQAKCVGGGGVINNAVCFRMPDFVKKEWDELGANLNDQDLKAAFDRIRDELHIRPADEVMARIGNNRLNRSRELFLKGVKKLGISHGEGDPDLTKAGFYPASVNLADCLGCGYCNFGCAYDRKNNDFIKYLPEAVNSGRCDVVTQANVDEVVTDILGLGHLKASGLTVKFSGGKSQKVKARKYILSAGAIATSGILLRSQWISLMGLPIGERFSANVGTPVNARFREKLDSYDGLQISDYFVEVDQQGKWDWVAETWFHPPATQSQSIPGYLEDHFERMNKYAHYAAAAPLVGTQPVGKVSLNLFTRQPELKFALPLADLAKLKKALRRIAEIFLEAEAEEILIMARNELVLHTKAELARIENEIQQPDDLLVIGTGHPQGGNGMSDRKEKGKFLGVVGSSFKVHGVEDLYVCDASVFPSSVKVNPQWTIMALADLCSQQVLKEF